MFLDLDMCVAGFGVSSFVYDKSIYIMPRVLSNSTCALRGVVWRKMTSWYCRSVANGLLYIYFICNVFWAC